jgi:hypothetical protein
MESAMSTKQAVLLLCTVAAAAALVLAALTAASEPAGAATDVLPDLRMARLENLHIQKTSEGRKLRFVTIIVNVGAGKFEARGERSDTTTSMRKVTQRIYNDAGSYRELVTTAPEMYFAGDGHNHWHLRDLQTYELIRLDNGNKVGTGAKHGFCFSDNYHFGSTELAYYTGCGENQADALAQTMGLSRGWGDIYQAGLVDQYIDITGLTSGRYRLQATADADDWFLESYNSNNFTWVDIQIKGNSVKIVAHGPSAQPI